MRVQTVLPVAAACFILMVGCTSSPRSQEQVRHETAAATATIASDIKGAALGVRDGLRHKPENEAVDINSASKIQLEALPGMTGPMADAVIAHRPYGSVKGLRNRRILPRNVFDEIEPRLIAKL